MSSVLSTLRSNLAYVFIGVGVVWIGVAYATGSYLLVWPVVACVVSGALLKVFPEMRLTWPWAVSSAVLGLLVGVDQLHAWYPYLTGSFSTLAGEAAAIFGILLVIHALLLYVGWGSRAELTPAQSPKTS